MCRVLVIDDEEGVRSAVRRRLEREGFRVDTAGSATEGIDKIRQADNAYSVVVTDMSMDEPTAGLNVLQAAFSRDAFAEVIVMTAYGNVENAVECMRRGAFDYIEKNDPKRDAYEQLAEKVREAQQRRIRDLRVVELWEEVGRMAQKSL